MNESETVFDLNRRLKAGFPFVHFRFGDGDVFFATGTGPKLTGDGEEWSQELADRLLWAWTTVAGRCKTALIGDVESYAVSDGCEEQWHALVALAEKLRGAKLSPRFVHMEALRVSFGAALPFYRALALSSRSKIYVAPHGLAPAADMLGAEHVEVPLKVAWTHADRVADLLLHSAYEIVMFSAGRGGKIIQALLAEARPDITQIDIGSGLDILFTNLRRGTDRGADEDRLRAEYRAAGLSL